MNRMNSVLKEALEESKPSEDEIKKINQSLKDFTEKLEGGIKALKIGADVFVGGSFAKKTLVKKDKYDIDVYVRFDKKYSDDDLSGLTLKILQRSGIKDVEGVHGSRDYFQVNIESWFYFEIVPVLKVSKPDEAENITDLSFYHVKYMNKKARSEKLLDEIILAKRFCHANKVYGAESHIKGFSGYAIELLVCYYGSFAKFLKALSKERPRKDKIIIDMEKHYKNKNQIMMDLNSSKLESPIILIDPTYKQRNALATLSHETLAKSREAAREFLKNPKIRDFRIKEIDLGSLEKGAKSRREEFLVLEVHTDMQPGAIAGSKLLKFYNYFSREVSEQFELLDKGFIYDNEKKATCYFIAKKKGRVALRGPPVDRKNEVARFKKKHRKTFSKGGAIYAEEKYDIGLNEFAKKWKVKNKKITEDMYIKKVEIKS